MVSAGLLAVAGTAPAGVPKRMAAEASRMARRSLETPTAAPGMVSEAVGRLAQGVLPTMKTHAWLKAAAILGLAAIVAGGVARGRAGMVDAPMSDGKPKVAAKAAPGGDLARLQGTWDRVRPQVAGVMAARWEIRGNALAIVDERDDGVVSRLTAEIRLDEGATPRAIDTVLNVPKGTVTERGIYKIEGDTLTVCIGRISERRPSEFRDAAGEVPARLCVLRRRVVPDRPPAGSPGKTQGTRGQVDPG